MIKSKKKINHARMKKIVTKKQNEIRELIKNLRRFLKYPTENNISITDDKIQSRWSWVKYITFFSIVFKMRDEFKYNLKKFLEKEITTKMNKNPRFTFKIPEDRKYFYIK